MDRRAVGQSKNFFRVHCEVAMAALSLIILFISVLAARAAGAGDLSFVWLLLLPFRIMGIAVHGVLDC